MSDLLQSIRKAVQKLGYQRVLIAAEEKELQRTIRAYVEGFESQRALARELGISAAYLNDIVHGRRRVSRAFIERLLKRRET